MTRGTVFKVSVTPRSNPSQIDIGQEAFVWQFPLPDLHWTSPTNLRALPGAQMDGADGRSVGAGLKMVWQSLEAETHTQAGDAVIIGFFRQHPARVQKGTDLRREATLDSRTQLGEPRFGHVKLPATTTVGIGGETTLPQWKTQNQIGRGAVNEGAAGVFRIRIDPQAEVAGEEVVEPHADAQFRILLNDVAG